MKPNAEIGKLMMMAAILEVFQIPFYLFL